MLTCPFCDAPLTDRIDLEGKRFLVFRCMFSPEVDPTLSDVEVAVRLTAEFGRDGTPHFRRTCDTLHAYVTRGAGGRLLTSADGGSDDQALAGRPMRASAGSTETE